MSNNPQYQPQQPQQPQYQQQPMYQPNARKLNQERPLWKFIVYTIITCGIYSIVFWTGIGEDINMAASRRDGKKTMHFCLIYFLLTGLTCGVTASVDTAGLCIVMIGMFVGRIGPIMMLLFFQTPSPGRNDVRHAEGKYIVG